MRNTPVITPSRPFTRRADLGWAVGAALLVAAAVAFPRIMGKQWRDRLYAGAAPLFGEWLPHIGWGTGPAVAIAALVIVYGPGLAARLSWRRLLAVTWLTSVGWAGALALVDGWQRGFAGRLTSRDEYLHEVGGVTDIAAMLRGFSARILDFQPDSWTTHVSGHPPGALLVFVLLDRVGLGGGGWAGLLCVLVGCGAAVAVLVTLRALGAMERARAAAPFLALAPAAIWLAVSADALFAGVTAWAVALLAVATRHGARWVPAAVGSGLLFGFGLYLSYGLVLMAVPALAVLAARGLRPVFPVVVGMLLVVGAFTAAGFWWFDGYHLVVERYYQGIASERPYSYWVWGNLAATVCAVGLASVAALHRVARALRLSAVGLSTAERGGPATRERQAAGREANARGASVRGSAVPALRRWRAVVDPAALLVAAGLAALLLADLSGLSKAETERIWLPFGLWVIAGTALLPRRDMRGWLAVQAVGALLVNHLVLTNW
ncbi:hypothetical protein [Nocardia otitidiscaviarum]|uniref:hypothetical protein n=1 Tax=Nocardia otitidiscaviarum TaxID=1823 RepID=UPI00163DCB93